MMDSDSDACNHGNMAGTPGTSPQTQSLKRNSKETARPKPPKRMRSSRPASTEEKMFSKMKDTDIQSYFGAVDYPDHQAMLDESSSWTEVLNAIIEDMNAPKGPGLDVSSAEDLLTRYPMDMDWIRQQMLFQPLLELNSSERDLSSGAEIRATFDELRNLLVESRKEVIQNKANKSSDYYSDASQFVDDVAWLNNYIKSRIKNNSKSGSSGDAKCSTPHSDVDGLHYMLTAVIADLIKLSTPREVMTNEQLRIRTNGTGVHFQFYTVTARTISDIDDDDQDGGGMHYCKVLFSGKSDVIVEETDRNTEGVRAPLVVEVKRVLHNLTDGPISDSDVTSPTGYPLRQRSASGDESKVLDQVNDSMKPLLLRHFMQLMASMRSYDGTVMDSKCFGMYVVMNRIYFTSLHVISDTFDRSELQTVAKPKVIKFANDKAWSLSNSQNDDGFRYCMTQTRGLNWLNSEHCKALLAFVQYLIRRPIL